LRHARVPCETRRLRAPRRFAALFHAARALWSRPTELSLLEEPYPLSWALASLRVRVRPPNGAARSETFATPFASRADYAPQLALRLAGLGSWDEGSLESLGRRASRVAPLVCATRSRIAPGSPDSAIGTPASKLFSPRESVRAATRPWPGMVGHLGRCSLEPFPSKACSSIPRVRCVARTNEVGCEPVPRASSRSRHLATSIRQARALIAGPRTHDPQA